MSLLEAWKCCKQAGRSLCFNTLARIWLMVAGSCTSASCGNRNARLVLHPDCNLLIDTHTSLQEQRCVQNCVLLPSSLGKLISVLLVPCSQAVDLLQKPEGISMDSKCTYCLLHLHKEPAKEPLSSQLFPMTLKYALCARKNN